MAVVSKMVTINAPPEKVFSILDDPNAIPQYAPGVTRVADIKQSEKRLGDSARVTYSVMGIRFPMKMTVVDYTKPSKLSLGMEGGMKGTMTWMLGAKGKGTETNIRIDYQMKGGILGKAINTLLMERMNEKNAERMLENLKMLCEAPEKK